MTQQKFLLNNWAKCTMSYRYSLPQIKTCLSAGKETILSSYLCGLELKAWWETSVYSLATFYTVLHIKCVSYRRQSGGLRFGLGLLDPAVWQSSVWSRIMFLTFYKHCHHFNFFVINYKLFFCFFVQKYNHNSHKLLSWIPDLWALYWFQWT